MGKVTYELTLAVCSHMWESTIISFTIVLFKSAFFGLFLPPLKNAQAFVYCVYFRFGSFAALQRLCFGYFGIIFGS
jgi:hypothetical protein